MFHVTRPALRRNRSVSLLLLNGIAIAAFLASAGCKKGAANDPHAHAAGKAPTGSHSHEHGHEQGAGEHTDEVHLTPEAIARYGVTVQPAQLWLLRPTLSAPARVEYNPEAMAHVGSPLRGRAVQIQARLGDTVKKGETLATIESPELGEAQADYLQRRTAAQAAAPAIALAKLSWERAKTLHEQSQSIALAEVQKREAEYQSGVAARQVADAAVSASEHRLRLLGMTTSEFETLISSGKISPLHIVTAPIDGRVIEREVTQGELVGPDRESMFILADTRTLWVLADVPEARAAEIAPGATAWVRTSAAPTPRIEATVTLLAPHIDPTTRTAQVRVPVPGDGALRPGMFAEVEIVTMPPTTGDPTPTIAVPAEAVQTVEGGPAVFVPVKGEPNTFAKRAVTIGKSVGGLLPIHAGLVEGEEFVTAGSFILKAELGKAGAAHEH